MFRPDDMVGARTDGGYDEVGTSASVEMPLRQKP